MERALVCESNHLLHNLLWHLQQPFHFLCQKLLPGPHGNGFRMQLKPPNREDRTPFEHPNSEDIQIHGLKFSKFPIIWVNTFIHSPWWEVIALQLISNKKSDLSGLLFSKAEIYLDSLGGPLLIPQNFYTALAPFLHMI